MHEVYIHIGTYEDALTIFKMLTESQIVMDGVSSYVVYNRHPEDCGIRFNCDDDTAIYQVLRTMTVMNYNFFHGVK